jgi:integrase
VKSHYTHANVHPNRVTQFLVAVLAGLQVLFVCSETHGLGEELVGSYVYQVHLYDWLESNDYGRFLADNDIYEDEQSGPRCSNFGVPTEFLRSTAGELFALRVEDVNLKDGVITVRRSIFKGMEGTPKNGEIRHVPIDSSVVAEIKKHLNRRKSGLVAFQSFCGERRWAQKSPNPL